ncbi:MAG: hypothetical protein K6F62_03300 [Schwartzia sp.]|nr:hypothetical protein [Schwartzia sp. (in: firmicutes)]
MKQIKRIMALFACGISTFTIMPNSNYIQAIPSAEQLTKRNWDRTGSFLKEAMERYQRVSNGQTK